MAKRSTTGRPKKVRDEKVYRSRAERERYYQRLAIISAIVGIVVMIVVVIGAVAYQYIVQPRQAITTVNGTEIETRAFAERVRAERWFFTNEFLNAVQLSGGNDQIFQALLGQLPPIPAPYTNNPEAFLKDDRAFGRYVLQNMELQVALEQEAEKLGVEVDEGEIQAQVDTYFQRYTGVNLTPTAEPSITPVQTETPTPFITATPTNTPTETPIPSATPLPTSTGCAEGEECPTVTPLPSATPTNTPTATPEQSPTPMATSTPISQNDLEATLDSFSDDFYGNANEAADVDREAVRDIFYLRALRVALREEVTQDIATEAIWADVRHILVQAVEDTSTAGSAPFSDAVCESDPWVEAKTESDQLYAALVAGEPFGGIARAASDDPSGADGGELGWTDTGGYVEPFREAVNNADIGAYLEPVCSQFGWHIIQVIDREVRGIPEVQLTSRRQEEYQAWEQDVVLNADVQRREDWPDRIPQEPTYDELISS
jgi:parvulin-like peptidyl-prolyl isomerase